MNQAMCGGCQGLGSHRRHCPRNPNYDIRLMWADRAEDIGDSIGPNNMGAANHCYTAAGLLRQQVKQQREEQHVRQEEARARGEGSP